MDELPEEAEEPELSRLETRFPVISVSLYGEIARGRLYQIAEQIKDELIEIPGVASVGVAGDREWELWVVADPQRLAARGVALADLGRALRQNLARSARRHAQIRDRRHPPARYRRGARSAADGGTGAAQQ